MDKAFTKTLCMAFGIRMPEGDVYSFRDIAHKHPMPRPYVAKPMHEGSSVGVYIVQEGDEPLGSHLDSWPYLGKVMIEAYIPGTDIFCAVMGDIALPLVEVLPKKGFYNYKAKYTDNMAIHRNPIDMPKSHYKRIQDWSIQVHQMFGCRGISRSDFRYNPETGDVYFLEVNPIPGLTPLSLVPDAAKYAGLSYDDLMVWLVEDALCPDVRN